MIEIKQPILDKEATIRVPEYPDDMEEFYAWLDAQAGKRLAVDTETTGLGIFSEGFRVRTLQIGYGLEAWVLFVEHYVTKDDLSFLLDHDLVFHNASFDTLALRQFFGLELDWSRIVDTHILAHLWNPVPKREGGVGHSLQDLTHHFLDPVVAEEIKGSMNRMCKEQRLKKDELFASIPLTNETYLRYAGMDVVLASALEFRLQNALRELEEKVPAFEREYLIRYEHELAAVCAEIEFNGFLLDTGYAEQLSRDLLDEQEYWEAVALVNHGTESVNASAQVAEDLMAMGVRLNELTDSGAYKMDKTVLEPLAEQGNDLAIAVIEAKRAKKWRMSWVDKFLDGADENNRCHAHINPLAARTARMSITGIPAQTLPSGDWIIRRCFVADPGEVIVSCDYQAQELRVLAALSGDQNMINAFETDADLHQMTANASGVERSVGKTVNFAYVYGSGPANIASTCGISIPKARQVIKGFETTYPGVKRYSDFLQYQGKNQGYIVTPTGRVLPVSPDRPYAALNYMIQSTSRDITASALLKLHEMGITPFIRLPIHDEILASVPEDKAEQAAKVIADAMQRTFNGVNIASDHDVLGFSWGHGYADDEEKESLSVFISRPG